MTGASGNFSSGGDVFEIIGPLIAMKTADLLQFTTMTGNVVKAMRGCPQPIIAAIDGICAGAGAIVAMASDLRIGTPNAKIAFLLIAGSDSPAAIWARALFFRASSDRGALQELLFTGRVLGGEEAHRSGLLQSARHTRRGARRRADARGEIAAGPTFANGMTKRMLEMEWAMSVDSAVEAEAVAQALCMKTEDFARAYHAFAAKQKPVFEGN